MVNWKEIAKFASGMAAFNVLGHIFLALGGFLPMSWFGFTLTQTNNAIIIVVSAVVSSALAYYAWIKKWGGSGANSKINYILRFISTL